MVDNMGNGLEVKSISLEEFHEGVARNIAVMEKVLGVVLGKFPSAPAAAASGDSKGDSKGKTESKGERTTVDLVLHARYVVPVEPAGVVHENHSLVVNKVSGLRRVTRGVVCLTLSHAIFARSGSHCRHSASQGGRSQVQGAGDR
jgi:hypothetical protein